MAGPFPGMDPYIELGASWPDFHNALIAEIRNELGVVVPDSYFVRIEERIEIAGLELEPLRSFRPDVVVGRFDERVGSSASPGLTAATATLEPTVVEILDRDREEIRVTWVEIRSLPNYERVTAIEVLSHINKSWPSRQHYLAKRAQLHDSRVNFVEIDLLLGGIPLPMKERSHPGTYCAIVARASKLPLAEVYRWTVRDSLPRIPIPLRDSDPDVSIDLAASVNRVYNLGRYARTLRHELPLPETSALTPEDRAWIQSQSGVGVD
jgi:hypothetical protein